MNEYPPILICGAPGSGTSFATRLLRYVGLFVGVDAGPLKARKYHESVSFRDANNRVLQRTIEFPYAPKSVAQFENHVALLKQNLDDLIEHVQIKKVLSKFWGDQNEREFWGWKDPRNSANLLLWKNIFPDLKIIIVEKQWRRQDRKQKGSAAGEWFRSKSNRKLRTLYIHPPYLDGLNTFHLQLDQIQKDHQHLQSLWDWLDFDVSFIQKNIELESLINSYHR
ncbi:MAG: hypothetical protein AAF939_04310 [Planctomycetota bacterium]